MRETTRRDFIRAALIAGAAGWVPGCHSTGLGPALEELPAYRAGDELPWRNWAGNQGCRPAHRAAPASEAELAELLRDTPGQLRPVGAGHSFTALVPSEGTLVASDLMSGVRSVDAEGLRAEVWAGTRLHQLGPELAAHGQAMPNLPDIDYQTLGGATATSSHGTGIQFGSLSHYIDDLTLVTPSGELVTCSAEQHPELYHAARCSMGALGVVTRMTLRNRTPRQLTETTRFEHLDDVLAEVDERRRSHEHFEFYAFPQTRAAMSITTDEGAAESTPAPEDEADVEDLRLAYKWVGGMPGFGRSMYERLVFWLADEEPFVRSGPSYRVLTHPRLTRFREMEYTIPAEAGPACLEEILGKIRSDRIPVVFPIEYRYVAADDIWLSMFHERDGCSISIHQYADQDHRPYFDAVEPIFWKYGGRPHWGKLHTLDAEALASLYPRWQDFLEVREALDPDGRLLNDHLRVLFGLGAGARAAS